VFSGAEERELGEIFWLIGFFFESEYFDSHRRISLDDF